MRRATTRVHTGSKQLALLKRLVMRSTTVLLILVAALVLHAPHASTNSTESTLSISIHAAKRGNPRMNLQDGRSAVATYKNATSKVVSNSLSGARPLSLASGDLNVDGYPDSGRGVRERER